MDGAELVRLLMAFAGGSVSTKLIEHLLSQRASRRDTLRPKDLERIKVVRETARMMLQYQGGKAFALAAAEMHGDPTDMSDEDFLVESQYYLIPRNDAEKVVIELDDKRLLDCWQRYCSHVDNYAYKYFDASIMEGKNEVYDKARESLNALLQRLNQIERRR